MRTLLAPASQIPLVPFLNAHATELSLLCEPDFVLDLHYARRDAPDAAPVAFAVETLGTATRQMLRRLDGQPDTAPRFVVAAPADEAARLAELRRAHPGLVFLGLAQDVVPAIVAGAGHRLLAGQAHPERSPVKLVVVVKTAAAAAPLLALAFDELGLARPAPHLCDSLVELFASSYRFDAVAMLRRWLADAASGGVVATELEIRLLQDLIESCGTGVLARALGDGDELYPVFVDRADPVQAAIDAARSDGQAVTADAYDRHGLLDRLLGQAAQTAFLEGLRRLVPRRLDLVFEPQLADPVHLACSLAGYLGVSPPGLTAGCLPALPDAEAMAVKARLEADLAAFCALPDRPR